MTTNTRNNLCFDRRGDHVEYQKEHNSQVITEDYFLDAMDMYRLVLCYDEHGSLITKLRQRALQLMYASHFPGRNFKMLCLYTSAMI